MSCNDYVVHHFRLHWLQSSAFTLQRAFQGWDRTILECQTSTTIVVTGYPASSSVQPQYTATAQPLTQQGHRNLKDVYCSGQEEGDTRSDPSGYEHLLL